MARDNSKEQNNHGGKTPAERSGETHSGTPNPVDPDRVRSTEHKSGYGGEGGEPRTSTDKREPPVK